jgi:hypothetical protein
MITFKERGATPSADEQAIQSIVRPFVCYYLKKDAERTVRAMASFLVDYGYAPPELEGLQRDRFNSLAREWMRVEPRASSAFVGIL